jgi:hypothetical protein
MDVNQRENGLDEEFRERIKKPHQQIDETRKKAKRVEAERDQLQNNTSLLSSSIVGVPVTQIKLANDSSAYALIESTVGFSTIRPRLAEVRKRMKPFTVPSSGASTPFPKQRSGSTSVLRPHIWRG